MKNNCFPHHKVIRDYSSAHRLHHHLFPKYGFYNLKKLIKNAMIMIEGIVCKHTSLSIIYHHLTKLYIHVNQYQVINSSARINLIHTIIIIVVVVPTHTEKPNRLMISGKEKEERRKLRCVFIKLGQITTTTTTTALLSNEICKKSKDQCDNN